MFKLKVSEASAHPDAYSVKPALKENRVIVIFHFLKFC